MRTTFLTLIAAAICVGAWSQAASVNWMTIEEAVEAQQREPRKIVMDVYTKWCGPCKMMMANTFTNPDVIDYLNANYYPVKFDAESADPVTFQGQTYTNPNYVPNKPGRNGVHQFSQALGVRAYPTLVFLDEKSAIIAPISGYKTPPQLELYLRFFEDAYTPSVAQSDWEAYQNTFQPSW